MNVQIADWLVSIEGDSIDLEKLGRYFERTTILVVKEEGDFFIKANSFGKWAQLSDAHDVLQSAQQLLASLGGVYKAQTGAFSSIRTTGRVIGIDGDGKRHSKVLMSGHGEIILEGIVSRNTRLNQALPNPNAQLADLLQSDAVVAAAFRYMGYPTQRWSNLYKVLDTIEADVAKKTGIRNELTIVEQGWATEEEMRAFTGTANSQSVLMDEARHGVLGQKQPKKVLTLGQAEVLLKRIIERWLDWRQ
jgi:hypothetical protein